MYCRYFKEPIDIPEVSASYPTEKYLGCYMFTNIDKPKQLPDHGNASRLAQCFKLCRRHMYAHYLVSVGAGPPVSTANSFIHSWTKESLFVWTFVRLLTVIWHTFACEQMFICYIYERYFFSVCNLINDLFYLLSMISFSRMRVSAIVITSLTCTDWAPLPVQTDILELQKFTSQVN